MESGGCYKTTDMTFYLPTQLLVSDTTCGDNRSEATNNVWRRDYVKAEAFSPKGRCFVFPFKRFLQLLMTQSLHRRRGREGQLQESPYN